MIDKTGLNFNNSYADLPDMFYTSLSPTRVPSPSMVILNKDYAKELGLNLLELDSNYATEIFAGNKVPEGSYPIAQAYCGHQFGHFNMLGDGRAILLGEHITPNGTRLDIQLKGSGRTPYSRGGDGRAALGPMLREYIISEAMYNLGIPTTRSLAVVTTGKDILRETRLPGAILTRVASSHIRVGTFQFASAYGSLDEVKLLADYTLERHFKVDYYPENPYLFLLQDVIKRQAELIAKWQLVGFIHGVMNTDNMAISGESIDYGPCAFMDTYDKTTVFSSIDTGGRYAYGNQPNMAAWNLARFAEAILPLIHSDRAEAIKLSQDEILKFTDLYNQNWLAGMRKKLGLFNEKEEDLLLVRELLELMEKYKADYTNTFVALTSNNFDNNPLFASEEFNKWNKQWQDRLDSEKGSKEKSKELMKKSNPIVIPRNHRVEEALAAAVNNGDYSVMDNLLDVLSDLYNYSLDKSYYSTAPEKQATCYKTYCGT